MTIIATEFTAYANAQTTDEAVYAIKFSTRIIAIGEFRTINTSGLELVSIMGPLSRPLPKILRVPSDRTVLSSEAPKVELIRNLIA